MARAAVATAVLMSFALPAQAHTRAEIESFEVDWAQRFAAADSKGEPVIGLLTERRDFLERHDWYWNPPPAPMSVSASTAPTSEGAHRGMGDSVEVWRGLVAAYFGAGDVERVLCLIAHESGGNPDAQNSSSGAAGLLQIMGFWADHYGVSRSALFDPATNLSIGRKIRDTQGWTAWSPYKRGECR